MPSSVKIVAVREDNNNWAEQYQRLIWTLEVIRDHLNTKGHTFRIADIEVALFMMGK
jgi:hypothetical protein